MFRNTAFSGLSVVITLSITVAVVLPSNSNAQVGTATHEELDEEVDNCRFAVEPKIPLKVQNAKHQIPELINLLNDPDDRIRLHAAGILGEIGPPAAEATAALSEKLQQNDYYTEGDVLTNVQFALGQIATKEAIEILSEYRRNFVPQLIQKLDRSSDPIEIAQLCTFLGDMETDAHEALETMIKKTEQLNSDPLKSTPNAPAAMSRCRYAIKLIDPPKAAPWLQCPPSRVIR